MHGDPDEGAALPRQTGMGRDAARSADGRDHDQDHQTGVCPVRFRRCDAGSGCGLCRGQHLRAEQRPGRQRRHHGRPIKDSWEDDQTRPDKAAKAAKKFVADQGVLALVAGSSIVDCVADSPCLEANGVISRMAAAVAPQCFTSKNVAMLNQGPRCGLVSAVAYATKNLGIKHIVCPEPTMPGANWI